MDLNETLVLENKIKFFYNAYLNWRVEMLVILPVTCQIFVIKTQIREIVSIMYYLLLNETF